MFEEAIKILAYKKFQKHKFYIMKKKYCLLLMLCQNYMEYQMQIQDQVRNKSQQCIVYQKMLNLERKMNQLDTHLNL